MKNLNELMISWINGEKSLCKSVINPARINRNIKQTKEGDYDVFEDSTGKLILNSDGIVDFIRK